MAADGTVLVSGRVVRGAVVLGTHTSSVELRGATLLASSADAALVLPAGCLGLSLMLVGRYSDGWLGGTGAVTIWPETRGGTVAGRLVLPVRPRPGGGQVTLRFTSGGSAKTIVRHAVPGGVTDVVVPVCSTGPIRLDYRGGPVGFTADRRLVAARAGKPRFVSTPGGC